MVACRVGFCSGVVDRCFATGKPDWLSLLVAVASKRGCGGRSICLRLSNRRFGLSCVGGDPGFRRCWGKPITPARPFADGIRGFRVGCFAQAALGALDALLERKFFSFVELFLANVSASRRNLRARSYCW